MTQLLYITILLFCMVLAYLARRTKKKIYLFALIAVLAIASGFRGKECGADTASYYSDIVNGFPYPWHFREEGFRFVSNFFMNKFHNPQLMFIFCALVTNFLIVLRIWDFRDSTRFDFMILLYLMIFYSNSMNIMRQYVAVALVFYATRFLDKKKILFIPLLFIAFLFHRSALLGALYVVLAYWSGFSKKTKKFMALPILIFLGVCLAYVISYLATDVESYFSQSLNNINFTYCYLLMITAISMFCYYQHKTIIINNLFYSNNKVDYKIDSIIIISTIIGVAFSSLSMFYSFVGRTGLYFSIFSVVYWGIASSKLKNSKLNKTLIIIYAIYVFGVVIFRNDLYIFPYSLYIY